MHPLLRLPLAALLFLGCSDRGREPGLGDGGLLDGAPADAAGDRGLTPRLRILQPTAGTRVGREVPVLVEVVAARGDDLQVLADGVPLGPALPFAPGEVRLAFDAEALPEGRTELVVTGTTRGLRVASEPVEVLVTWLGPEVFIDGVPDAPLARGVPLTLGLRCASPTCAFECRLDEASFAPCTTPWELGALPVGPHRVEVVATGARGHTTVPPAEAGFEVTFAWGELALGRGAGCAITAGDALFCWGDREGGRAPLAGDGVQTAPRRVGEGRYRSVSLERLGESTRGCAVRDDGALVCWGDQRRELGPVPTVLAAGAAAARVSVGGGHTCLLDDAGALRCGGANDRFQLGRPDAGSDAALGLTDATRRWTDLSAGGAHTCALSEGELHCFGDDARGAAGLGTSGRVATPTRVGPRDDWRAIATARDATCGVAGVAGEVWCFGEDVGGRLGGSGGVLATPTRALPETGFVDVGVGARFACALRDDGSVWCWGEDLGTGVLGRAFDGDAARSGAAPVVTDVTAVALAVSAEAACLRTAEGEVRCWGTPATGDNDLALANPPTVPVPTAVDEGWRALALTATHGCGVRADSPEGGALRCWGDASAGQLGTGDRVARPAPVRIGEDADWADVVVAPGRSCARRADERLFCWGEDGLGGGTSVPQRLDGRFSAVALSQGHACAIRGGSMVCWGSGGAGQLGLGDRADRSEPTAVDARTDWTAVAVGEERSCGRRGDGTWACWGVLGQAPRTVLERPRELPGSADLEDLLLLPEGDVARTGGFELVLFDRRDAPPSAGERATGSWSAIAGATDGFFCGERDGFLRCAPRPFDDLEGGAELFPTLMPWQSLHLAAGDAGGSACLLSGGVRLCWGPDARSVHGRGYARWRPIPLREPDE